MERNKMCGQNDVLCLSCGAITLFDEIGRSITEVIYSNNILGRVGRIPELDVSCKKCESVIIEAEVEEIRDTEVPTSLNLIAVNSKIMEPMGGDIRVSSSRSK